MTRLDHLNWCKQRALAYVDVGEVGMAFTSMLSDLSKDSRTEASALCCAQLGFPMLASGLLSTREQMRRFIEDFS